MRDNEEVYKSCLVSILIMLAIVPMSILNGWVLSTMWGWFVVPTFKVAALGIAPAIGLSALVGYVCKHTNEDIKNDNKKPVGERAIIAMLTPFFLLGVGYIVHLFMP